MQPVNTEHIKEERKVPNLRFPGFEWEWMTARLEEFCNRISDGIHATPVYDDAGQYYFVNGNNLVNGKIEIDDNTKRVSREEYVKHKRDLDDRTILMSINGTIGNLACYGNEKVVLGKSACYINVTKQVEKAFIYNTLQLRSIKYFFNSELTGTTIKNLSLKTIKNTNVNIPSLSEQQKIAYFLSSVDKKIQQLTRKKELLEQYKKGVMQKIFSREIRFKDENGNDFPDWEEKRLGDILTFISTNSLSRNDLNYDSGEIKNIHYGDIHTTFKMGFDVEKEKVPFINEEVDLRNISKDQFCQVGDIVVADASEDYSDIGKAIEVLNVGNERIVSGLHTFLARDTAGQTIKGFKGYLFQTWQIRKQIMKVAQGISVLGISKKNLAKVEFLLPCIEEQGKIIFLLKNIDKKITNTFIQINQTQQFKKGLLQQMFV